MSKEEPKVLTRMRLSCCWGDNLNEKELNEVVDYITYLQRENKQLKERIDKAIGYINSEDICIDIRKTDGSMDYVSEEELLEILEGKSE